MKCASLPLFPFLPSFDDCVDGVRGWLKQMELSLRSEPALAAEDQEGAPDSTEELEKMENLHKDLLLRKCVCVCVCVCDTTCYDMTVKYFEQKHIILS